MLKKIIWLICKVWGWRFDPTSAEGIEKYVLLGVPHTSNWDFLPAVGFMSTLPFPANFAIKSEWMKFPFNLIMGPVGAVGLDREKAKDPNIKTTDLLADLFKDKKNFALGISPEGSRSLRTKWKSGFYHVAKKAGVPILLANMDYKNKVTSIGLIVHPSDDIDADMKKIADYYKGSHAKNPKKFSIDLKYDS